MKGSRASVLYRRGSYSTVLLLLLAGLILTTTGVSCADVPFVTSTFRDASMDQISAGVKDIVNGIIDGIFAVLQEAGDGGAAGSS